MGQLDWRPSQCFVKSRLASSISVARSTSSSKCSEGIDLFQHMLNHNLLISKLCYHQVANDLQAIGGKESFSSL